MCTSASRGLPTPLSIVPTDPGRQSLQYKPTIAVVGGCGSHCPARDRHLPIEKWDGIRALDS